MKSETLARCFPRRLDLVEIATAVYRGFATKFHIICRDRGSVGVVRKDGRRFSSMQDSAILIVRLEKKSRWGHEK